MAIRDWMRNRMQGQRPVGAAEGMEREQGADGIVHHIAETHLLHLHCLEVRMLVNHGKELFQRVGRLVELGHSLYLEGGEDIIFQHLLGDGELTFHQRIPLLQTVNTLYEGLDIHLSVADLCVVHIVGATDDVGFCTMALPYFLGNRCAQTGHSLGRVTEAATETAELKARL